MIPTKATVNTLFFSGLAPDVDEETIRRQFEKLDKTIRIRNITIYRERASYRSKGSGFIELEAPEDCIFTI